ncbi:hypothetical protein ENBRE01_2163 [Enteropsectra breve]|nr:hypothetical protein ENBRE01_2163 [Enteropsectra breve]
MDILKRASSSIESCKITQDSVFVNGVKYSAHTAVVFPSKKSKEYNLAAVLFFLINSEIPLADYMVKCKKEGMQAISYPDQASIRMDIANYKPSQVRGFFVSPFHTHHSKNYEIPPLSEAHYILVPSDALSPVNKQNLAALLTEGKLCTGLSLKEDPAFTYNGTKFKIADSTFGFSSQDWHTVAAVFLHDKETQLRQYGISLPKEIPKFSLAYESGCTKLKLQNNNLLNLKEVWNEILSSLKY